MYATRNGEFHLVPYCFLIGDLLTQPISSLSLLNEK